MGLFSKKTEPKSLFDFLELSIEEIKNISYEKVKDDITQDGEAMIDYLGKLPKTILKVFDHIELKIFSDEFKLDGSVQINAFFKILENDLTENKIAYLTNHLYSFFGKDDHGEKDWSYEISNNLSEEYWSGRTYTLDKDGKLTKDFTDCYEIVMHYDDEGLHFNILFISNMFKE